METVLRSAFLNQAELLGVYGELASQWRAASDRRSMPASTTQFKMTIEQTINMRGRRSLLVALAVVRCPALASVEECSGGTAGVLEQRGRRGAPPLS